MVANWRGGAEEEAWDFLFSGVVNRKGVYVTPKLANCVVPLLSLKIGTFGVNGWCTTSPGHDRYVEGYDPYG